MKLADFIDQIRTRHQTPLLETPSLMNEPLEIDAEDLPVSIANMERGFERLGELPINGIDVTFWLCKRKARAAATIQHPDYQKYQMMICSLRFATRANVGVYNPLQVSLVHSHPLYMNQGIAQILYTAIAAAGYDVISDYTQFLGGQGLWKRIANFAAKYKQVVRLWSEHTSDWVRTESGHVVQYTPETVPDETVWTTDPYYGQKSVLLVLSDK